MSPTAVLFDLDGVLLDSRVAIASCIQHGLRETGAPVPEAADLERFIGPPLIDAFAELAGPERVGACLAAYRERYVWSSLEETTVVPGTAEALAAVAARVPVAVATTKPRAFAEPLCERLGLAPGADAPLVGDRSHDAEAARANGLRCVGVLWGIGDEAELRASGADPIVASPDDLPAALLRASNRR